ncbi:putative short-chain dehydrogenase reductase [Phaeomoniella chlamydospora]|uniref:Putative short-chain dehydrogenase reductase n=1 Tax=Phaeomoniella chlamydospora TaxID=158046 RepID=A0A0G2GLL5_PHACM|nr:putative short-chain dehydrogenase reductase [Phaeomoniella chlamydospora]
MPGLLNFLYSQLFITPPYPRKTFEGKTIIVTGSNTGLGLEAARHFVRLHASTVILAVRNSSKGNAAKKSIEASENCKQDIVEVWPLDLCSYDSVQAFAKKVDELPRVDAIIENAGISPKEFTVIEGHESTITTNVISTFLLALLVLPRLKETAREFNTRPYLSIVTSLGHGLTTFPQRKSPSIFEALANKEMADMPDRYNVSKLLQIFVVRELVDSIRDNHAYPVVINCVNPGLCHSQIFDDGDTVSFKIARFFLARTTEKGSRALVNAAGEIGDESRGQYLSDCQVSKPSPLVLSEEGKETQKRVWLELSSILEHIVPGVTQNI